MTQARDRKLGLITALLAVSLPSLQAAEIPFDTQLVISSNALRAQAVHVADIDGDGDLDLLSASQDDDKIAWYRNDDGAWVELVISSSAVQAKAVYAADVDGDGDLDVLSASQGDGKIAWYVNDGSPAGAGDWTEQVITNSSSSPRAVWAADLDGDGDVDVLGASNNDDRIAWYENDGTPGGLGDWAERTISALADKARSVAAADVDGDGDIDVLSASCDDDKIAWYENDGQSPPQFPERIITVDPDGAGGAEGDADCGFHVRAADIDGDGDLDVQSASFFDGDIYWYENDGTPAGAGDWLAHPVGSAGPTQSARSVAPVDLDADGDMDIVATHGQITPWNVSWYENLGGTPPLWQQRSISVAADGANVALAIDADGDGDLDVVSASGQDDEVALYENLTIHRSAAFPVSDEITTTLADAPAMFVDDIDRDGDLDVVGISSIDLKVAWYENNGTSPPAFTERVVREDPGNGPDQGLDVATADFDGDGDPDILAVFPVPEDTIVWFESAPCPSGCGGSPVQFAEKIITQDPDGPGGVQGYENGANAVHPVDLDQDGDMDFLTASQGDDRIAWWENLGADECAMTGGACSVTADCPGDASDLCRFRRHTIVDQTHGTDGADVGESVYAADLNGDGLLDVLSASREDDTIAWYQNLGGTPPAWTPWPIVNETSGTDRADSAFDVFAADLDGDGDMDVLSASFGDDKIAWYENTGSPAGLGSWVVHVITTAADEARSVFAIDLDGDGDQDVLSASTRDSKIAWYENQGNTPPLFVANTISDPSNPVPAALGAVAVTAADIDGDGDVDPVSASDSDDKLAWYENRGGQFALRTLDTSASAVANGATDDLVLLEVFHRGRSGDSSLILTNVGVRLEDGTGTPLDAARANTVIDRLLVYSDTDESGDFDAAFDTMVAETTTLAPVVGVELLSLGGQPSVQATDSGSYFVVIQVAAGATAGDVCELRVHPLLQSDTTADDASAALPLSREFASPTAPSELTFRPSVVSVQPGNNALDVAVSTNVTVVFSQAIDPTSVTPANFRLLDPGGVPVAATVSVSPSGLQATLDPVDRLDNSVMGMAPALYTVELLDSVRDVGQCMLQPFSSLFETEEAGLEGTLISEVAVGAALAPPGPTQGRGPASTPNLGLSTSQAGDINGDGLQDAVAGAPGTEGGAGTVAVFFGDASLANFDENNPPPPLASSIEFTGAGTDRAGTAVVGGFDFNHNDKADLLIGAPGANSNAGSVYLILDLEDYALASPPVMVPLASIGQPGCPNSVETSCPGVVFTGESPGDLAGTVLAAGGLIDANSEHDILIGAPGEEGVDAGHAYLVFDHTTLSGTHSLAAVTTGALPGIKYQGAAPGDNLGYAVAFPGDITSGAGDDLALGAPRADPAGDLDAGTVYVVEGGSLPPSTATVIVSTIPIQIHGDEDQGDGGGEQLGFSIAGGGDHRQDGEQDLLIGAPFYDLEEDPGPPQVFRNDAGRVIQTSTPLTAGSYRANNVTNELDGIVWIGEGAGDQLGYWVAGVGDLTSDEGDPIDEIVLGAPFADPRGNMDAGVAYVLEGPARSGSCASSFTCSGESSVTCIDDTPCVTICDTSSRFPCGSDSDCLTGTCDGGHLTVDLVEGTFAGFKLVGTANNDQLGQSLAGTGDLDGTDGREDFVVGSPGYMSGTGNMWSVVNLEVPDVGFCDFNDGCTVADLATGAQVEVDAGSLLDDENLAASGNLDPGSFPAVTDRALVGVLEFAIDSGSGFVPCHDCLTNLAPPVTIQISATSEFEPQLQPAHLPEIYRWERVSTVPEVFQWSYVGLGVVGPNPHYPTLNAVSISVDKLATYGAFVTDEDEDRFLVNVDCDDTNPNVFPGNTEATCNGLDDDCDAGTEDDPNLDGDALSLCSGDCDDTCAAAWEVPGDVTNLTLDKNRSGPDIGVDLAWTAAPGEIGGSFVEYGTLRSLRQDDFSAAVCLSDPVSTDTASEDLLASGSDERRYYLIRATNCCAASLGQGSTGPRADPGICP